MIDSNRTDGNECRNYVADYWIEVQDITKSSSLHSIFIYAILPDTLSNNLFIWVALLSDFCTLFVWHWTCEIACISETALYAEKSFILQRRNLLLISNLLHFLIYCMFTNEEQLSNLRFDVFLVKYAVSFFTDCEVVMNYFLWWIIFDTFMNNSESHLYLIHYLLYKSEIDFASNYVRKKIKICLVSI